VFRVLDGFKFRRSSSLLHRLDPRSKFLMACVFFALAIIFTGILPLTLILLVQIPLVLVAGVRREWLRSLRGGVLLALLIFGTNLIVNYISAGYALTLDVVLYSTSMAVRFMALISSFSVFFLTTSPDDLGLALEQAKIPYEFCFAFTTAVRFVPVLAGEAQTIVDAQRSRGLELERGSFLKRVRNYVPILIPLIVGAIRRSFEMAEAMEARAFGAKERRTNLSVLRLRGADYATALIALSALACGVYLRYFLAIPSL
jgi:energy-coupling factor transport system permease protein